MSAFPPERLAAAIGVWSVTGGITAAAGPPIAGALIKLGDWRWTFWFNVPAGLLVLVLAHRHLVESVRDRTKAIPDPVGAVLVTVGVSPIVYALVKSTTWGWIDRRTIGSILAGLAILGLFVVRCNRHPNPLIDLNLFRLKSLRVANLGTFIIAITWFCVYWGMISYASSEWHWSPLHIGGSTAPVSLMAGISGIVVGRIAVHTGHRVFILPGAVFFAITAIVLWVMIDTTPSDIKMIIGSAVIGTASGCVFPSFIAASMVEVPVAQHSVGSGVNFMTQRIGTTVGVALALTFLTRPGGLDGLHRCLVVTIVGASLAFLIGLRIDTRPAD
jgi:MFS family permease